MSKAVLPEEPFFQDSETIDPRMPWNEQDARSLIEKAPVNTGEKITGILGALILFLIGIALVVMRTEFVYSIALYLCAFVLIGYGLLNISLFLLYGRHGRSRIVFGVFAFVFGVLLLFNDLLLEWIIRVCFGLYLIGISGCLFIQLFISYADRNGLRISSLIFALANGTIGVVLLFTDIVTTRVLFGCFGIYFCLLAFRFLSDLIEASRPEYSWKRSIRISLPTLLATILPDFVLSKINSCFSSGQNYPMNIAKRKEPVRLKAMVHIGPEGLQKVGHFTFSWKGMVYSYGNYDAASMRFFSMIGDGVYFMVPASLYLPNIVKYEQNTVFEYSIQTTPEQDALIEQELAKLKARSYRWYCPIERRPIGDTCDLETSYPSRLHYRTGAKFYKIKSGAFKTYWAAGDNCVSFADVILGTIGADVLSMRGIVTPGAYYDFLDGEYYKENSPVIERIIHSPAALQEGI